LSESIQGIVAEYGVQREWLEEHKRDLLARFANRALGDTIIRLARDPIRKLAPKDRLIGAAQLAEKWGISPDTLAFGIAAGYCFDSKEDELAVSLQQMITEVGIEETLKRVSGLEKEQPLAQKVLEHYHRIKQGKAFREG
jgi:mannitol-1-phosphate 5-dehydrogenase